MFILQLLLLTSVSMFLLGYRVDLLLLSLVFASFSLSFCVRFFFLSRLMHYDSLSPHSVLLVLFFLCVCVWCFVQPFLVSELLPGQIIPALYTTVELKLERIVDLGPFKHKVYTYVCLATAPNRTNCYIHTPPVVLTMVDIYFQ